APPPDAVDHRQDGTEGPIKDQGDVGSCTSFSLSSAMDNGIRRQNKGDTMSSLHIWSHYAFPNMSRAGEGNLNKAIADWAVWPYDPSVACELDQSGGEEPCGPYSPPVTQGGASSDPAIQASEKTAEAAGQWKVTEYDAVPTDPDSIAALLATGSDVWFSMEIGNSWMNPSGDTIADWDQNSIDGGHAVLLSGYRHKNGQRQFLIHNSWGPTWADNGYAYISESMLKQFIKSAYKVVVANASAPPPPPNDPNALTDDDCSSTQLVDAVSGQCATMCPDDSRPSNGQCVGAAATGGTKPPPKPPVPKH
ncbi:MAG: C1 family peptidase, partial [Acidimicrobiales bacterium]